MLAFMRKEGEVFYIGENIEITIAEIANHQVKVCINAPRNVPIIRKELMEKQSSTQNREDVAMLIHKLTEK